MPTHPSQPDNPFFEEFLDDFFAECDEHLAIIRRELLALEAAQGQPGAQDAPAAELLRSFHTLKGLSGMVGVQAIERLSHQIESYLRALSQRQVELTPEAFSALVAGTRTIEQVLSNYQARQPAPDIAAIAARLGELASSPAPEARQPKPAPSQAAPAQPSADEHARIAAAQQRGIPLWQAEFTPTPQLAEANVNVNTVRERLTALGEIVRAAPKVLAPGKIAFEFVVAAALDPSTLDGWRDAGVSFAPYTPAAPAALVVAPLLAAAPSNVVRVDLAQIDTLVRNVGDLVINRARLASQLAALEPYMPVPLWRALQETAISLERQLRDLRQGVVRLRLVPIGEVFARMQFVVHDIARESRKQIALDLQGQDTEIDKFVVERMLDPLLHLVRNALAHGLESPDERSARGKPPVGRIALRAATAGDLVIIEIEDDGRGIDVERVAERARALGLLEAGAPLEPAMLLDVLCTPGFSTREQADRVSGRGVGMDVVQRTVHELGGELSLDTALGRGTRFTIRLPLTLSIVDALIVAVGDQIFAMPMPVVREIAMLAPDQLTRLENNELLNYRGGALALTRLAHTFRLAERSTDTSYALVVANGAGAIGIVVDRIVGKREVVVRALSDPLVQVEGLSGATELGDGRPVLILDAPALSRATRMHSHGAPARGRSPARAPGAARAAAPAAAAQQHDRSEPAMTGTEQIGDTYVLCELAGATYAIPSQVVRHIELVEHVTPVPNAPAFVAGVALSRGQVLPALDLRARFGFEKIPYTLRSRMVVADVGDRTVGLIVDTAREFVRIPADSIEPPPEAIAGLSGAYLHGIARVRDRLVVVLDLGEVLQGAEHIAPAPHGG